MSSSSGSDSSSSTVVPPSLPESSVDGFVLRLAEQQSPLQGVAYSPECHDVQPSDIFKEAHEPVPRGLRLGRALSWEIGAVAAVSGATHRPC